MRHFTYISHTSPQKSPPAPLSPFRLAVNPPLFDNIFCHWRFPIVLRKSSDILQWTTKDFLDNLFFFDVRITYFR